LPLHLPSLPQPTNTERTQADVYSNGRSEEIIGKAITEYNIPRHRLVLLTKCYFGVTEDDNNIHQPTIPEMMTNDGDLVNRVGLSRKHIFDAVEASVKRLGTYIDV
jgi:versiconal hemiacetal acetate reductase